MFVLFWIAFFPVNILSGYNENIIGKMLPILPQKPKTISCTNEKKSLQCT